MTSKPALCSLLFILGLMIAVAPAAEAVTTGVVCGRITDAQTGKPLAAVNVVLVGTAMAGVTDSEGYFAIANVPPDTYRVSASIVGYQDGTVEGVTVTQDQSTVVDQALLPKVEEARGAEARVVAPRVAPRAQVTATSYAVDYRDEQLTRTQPNDLYQFPGVVAGQPGVVPDATGYPHIRGARAEQVGYMIEGIPIVEPNNNVFATNIVTVGLDRLELLTGGYSAIYGGYVGGVINEVIKRGDQVRGGFWDASLGSPWGYRGNIFEAGDVIGPVNWYLQTNSWDTNFPGNNFTQSCPRSSDGIAKIIVQAGAADRVTLLANHGYARYQMPFSHSLTHDPTTGEWLTTDPTQDYGRQGYDLDAISISHSLSPGTFWSLRAFKLGNWLHLDLGSEVQCYWAERRQDMEGLQFDYTTELRSGRHLVKMGAWQIWSDNYQLQAPNVTGMLPFAYDMLSDNDTNSLQLYLMDHWRANDRLVVDMGLRFDRMKVDRKLFPGLTLNATSPRLGATYSLNRNVLLRGAWGVFAQMPPAAKTGIVFPFSPDPGLYLGFHDGRSDLQPERDQSYEIGGEMRLSSQDLLSLSYFHRTSKYMVQKWYGVGNTWDLANGTVHFASTGHGHSSGLEVKLQRRSSERWSGWFAYTLSRSQATASACNAYPYGSDLSYGTGLNQEYYVDWDQRHTAALVLNYKQKRWEFSPSLFWGSGYAYGQSGMDVGGDDIQHGVNGTFTAGGVVYPAGTFTNVPILVGGNLQPDRPNALRTGSHLTLNLTASYRLRPEVLLYASVYNLLRSKDVTNLVWYDPNTGAVLGYVPPEGTPGPDNPGTIRYVPYTKTPPTFVAFGVRYSF